MASDNPIISGHQVFSRLLENARETLLSDQSNRVSDRPKPKGALLPYRRRALRALRIGSKMERPGRCGSFHQRSKESPARER